MDAYYIHTYIGILYYTWLLYTYILTGGTYYSTMPATYTPRIHTRRHNTRTHRAYNAIRRLTWMQHTNGYG